MSRFLYIEDPNAPQQPIFKENEGTGLPVKLTGPEKTTNEAYQNSPIKVKVKPTGKQTGGRPTHKIQTTRRMSLQTDDKIKKSINSNTWEKPACSNSDNDNQSATSLEEIAPSLKRQNQKRTPPTITALPQQKSTRNCQSALVTAFGHPVPIVARKTKNRNHVGFKMIRLQI